MPRPGVKRPFSSAKAFLIESNDKKRTPALNVVPYGTEVSTGQAGSDGANNAGALGTLTRISAEQPEYIERKPSAFTACDKTLRGFVDEPAVRRSSWARVFAYSNGYLGLRY